jgi:hypothetical protein
VICKTCKEDKVLGSFYVRKETGRPRSECKIFFNHRILVWQNLNRDKTKGYVRKSCKKAYDADPEKFCLRSKNKRLVNPEAHKVRVRQSYVKMQNNLTEREVQRRLKNSQNWFENNKEKAREAVKKHRLNNPTKHCAYQAKRRFLKSKATPSWLTQIQLAQIQEFYDVALAKSVQTGIKYEVDHIHPLNGNGFTGLHVPWNLQVLPVAENRAKGNKFMEA